MGIRSGYKITEDCGELINISSIENKCIAIDMMTYVIRFFKNTRSKVNWYENVLNFLSKFTNKNKVICVFDGKKKPIEKNLCLQERRKKRANFQRPMRTELRELIDIIKKTCTVYFAEGEGENLCCFLLKEHIVDEILGEDRDVILYGAEHFLMKYDGINCTRYTLKEIMTKRSLTFDQLFCLCLALGIDYNMDRPKILFKTAMENKIHLTKSNFPEYDNMKLLLTPSGNYSLC
jgi:5'-3' exonuclease